MHGDLRHPLWVQMGWRWEGYVASTLAGLYCQVPVGARGRYLTGCMRARATRYAACVVCAANQEVKGATLVRVPTWVGQAPPPGADVLVWRDGSAVAP